MNPLFNAIMGAPMQAQQMMNPQQIVARCIPGIPQEIQNDPGRIIDWLQQTGRVSQQQVQMARQMMGM